MSGFEGRTALITGGGTGMGRAFALALAERGAPVAVCGRRAEPIEETAELCRALGVAALASQVDVRDPEAVQAWVAAAGAALGPPRLLINNAAGNFLAHAIDLSPNGWRAVDRHRPQRDVLLLDARSRARMREAGRRRRDPERGRDLRLDGQPDDGALGRRQGGRLEPGEDARRRVGAARHPRQLHRARARSTARGRRSASSRREEIRERDAADIPAAPLRTLDDVVAGARFLLSTRRATSRARRLTVDGGQVLEQGMFRHSPIPQRR